MIDSEKQTFSPPSRPVLFPGSKRLEVFELSYLVFTFLL